MKGFDAFLRLSAALTGFTEVDLLGTGQAETYLRWIEDHADPATLAALLERAREPLTREAVAEILAAPLLGVLAKQVNYLWYTAQWQTMQDGQFTVSAIVSPAAYQEGLVWPASLTHPPGAKQTGFGSWESLPREGAAS